MACAAVDRTDGLVSDGRRPLRSPEGGRVVYRNVRKSLASAAVDRRISRPTADDRCARRNVVVSFHTLNRLKDHSGRLRGQMFGTSWRQRTSTGRPRVGRMTTAKLARGSRVVYGNVRNSMARAAVDRKTSCRTDDDREARPKAVVSCTEMFGKALQKGKRCTLCIGCTEMFGKALQKGKRCTVGLGRRLSAPVVCLGRSW